MKKEEVAVVSFSEMAGDVIPSCEIEERRISTRSSKQSETTTATNPILKVNSMKSFKNLLTLSQNLIANLTDLIVEKDKIIVQKDKMIDQLNEVVVKLNKRKESPKMDTSPPKKV